MIFNKSSANVYSSIISIFTRELILYFSHKFVLINKVFRDLYFSEMIGQISLVGILKVFLMKLDKVRNVFVCGDRLSDVINLSVGVALCGVREKNNKIRLVILWCDVDEFPFWRLPNAVELSLNKNLSPDMDTPANFLLSSVCDYMLWNNCKTFIDWFVRKRAQWDKNGAFCRNFLTEVQNKQIHFVF